MFGIKQPQLRAISLLAKTYDKKFSALRQRQNETMDLVFAKRGEVDEPLQARLAQERVKFWEEFFEELGKEITELRHVMVRDTDKIGRVDDMNRAFLDKLRAGIERHNNP